MFKRFSAEENISGQSAMKSSQQRAARARIIEQMPAIEAYIDDFFPKKEKTTLVKCSGHIVLLASAAGAPLFIQTRDGDFVPTMRTLHRYPFLLPVLRVDRGAVKHVINGANVMVPGLLSSRSVIDQSVAKGRLVAVFADGKDHALAVGKLLMSTDEIKATDKGIAIENLHHVSDDLWMCKELS